MGEVFVAEDTKLGRKVAIKMLPPTATANRVARQRLLREARSASALSHPNIVTIFTVEEHENNDVIVMEFVDGETVRQMVSRGPLDFSQVIDIGIQVADALAAAHHAGLIHRDIKSENILIGSNGQAKVLDFGLAKPTTIEELNQTSDTDATVMPEITAPGVICGTVAYMSPEQTRGEMLDERSDLFSLGTVLYEAATGRLPFEGPSVLSIMHDIATADKPPPSHVRPGLPPEFDKVVARSLAKDRANRFASALELKSALEHIRDRVVNPGAFDFARDTPYVFAPSREGFVGRTNELRELGACLEGALTGSGSFVLISGETGMGKSALVHELVDKAHRQFPHIGICRGQCAEQYGVGEAYLPFLEALGSLMVGPIRERLAAILKVYAPTWCLQLPAALTSTGTLEALQIETIGATKERMLREFGDALAALSTSTPLIVHIEDLQWADPSSVELLGHLSHRLGNHRILFVATVRPEDIERQNPALKSLLREMSAHNLCRELEISPLTKEQIAALLNVRFAPNTFADALAELIERKTEGNPLFVTSFAQFLTESGDVQLVDDEWRLARPLVEIDPEVPSSVRSMIRRKLEAIDDESLRALQYASVEGLEFTSTILAALLGVEDVDLEEKLKKLDRTHRLIATLGEEEFPDGELTTRYRYTHSLYHDLLYSDLVSKRKVQLHRIVGDRLFAHFGPQASRIAAHLAIHFERGRDFERAIEFYVKAGDNAMRVYANQEAEKHFSRALEIAERVDEETQMPHLLKAFEKRGAVNLAMSAFDRAAFDFRKAVDLARRLGDPDAECKALNQLSRTLFFSHRVDEMAQVSREAMKASGRARSEALRAETLIPLALKHVCYGELNEAKTLGDEIIRISRKANDKSALLAGLTRRGIVYYFQSEYANGRALIEEAMRLAEELRDGFAYLQAHFELGLIVGNQGCMSEALAIFHRATEVAQKNNDRFWLCRLPNCIGWIHQELQDFDGAYRFDREGVEISRREKILEAEANSLINLGSVYTESSPSDRAPEVFEEVRSIFDRDNWFRWRYNIRLHSSAAEYWLKQHNLEKAGAFAAKLLELAQTHEAWKYTAAAHKLLAEIALSKLDVVSAGDHLKTAVALFKRHPAPLVAWKTYAVLGRYCRAVHDEPGARRAFQQALSVVDAIAANVDEDHLRENFLVSAKVRELWSGA